MKKVLATGALVTLLGLSGCKCYDRSAPDPLYGPSAPRMPGSTLLPPEQNISPALPHHPTVPVQPAPTPPPRGPVVPL